MHRTVGGNGMVDSMKAWLHDPRNGVHAILTAGMAWLALILGLPPETFTSSASYKVLGRLMSENSWAITFGIIACIGLSGCVSRFVLVKMWSTMVMATAYAIMGVSLLIAYPIGTGSGTYLILGSVMSGYVTWLWAKSHSDAVQKEDDNAHVA